MSNHRSHRRAHEVGLRDDEERPRGTKPHEDLRHRGVGRDAHARPTRIATQSEAVRLVKPPVASDHLVVDGALGSQLRRSGGGSGGGGGGGGGECRRHNVR